MPDPQTAINHRELPGPLRGQVELSLSLSSILPQCEVTCLPVCRAVCSFTSAFLINRPSSANDALVELDSSSRCSRERFLRFIKQAFDLRILVLIYKSGPVDI